MLHLLPKCFTSEKVVRVFFFDSPDEYTLSIKILSIIKYIILVIIRRLNFKFVIIIIQIFVSENRTTENNIVLERIL